jgi:hypothetical protein
MGVARPPFAGAMTQLVIALVEQVQSLADIVDLDVLDGNRLISSAIFPILPTVMV